MIKKIFPWLFYLFLFLLPWQTRWIYDPIYLNGGFWEYGSGSLYGTEILLWIILVIFFIDFFKGKEIVRNFFPKNIFKLQLALWSGGIAPSVLAVWQFFTQNVFANKWLGVAEQSAGNQGASVIEFGGERWLRAYGSFGSPNALGIYLAVLLVLGLALYLNTENNRRKILITVGQLCIFSGLILSFSRGAWVAALVGLVCLAGISWVKTRHTASRLFKQLSFYLLTALVFFIALSPLFINRFNLSNRLEARSVSERITQAGEWKNIFSQHPFLGIGLNNYTWYIYSINPDLPVWSYQPVHNAYLLQLAEVGIFGMIFITLLWLFIVRLVLKKNIIYLSVIITLFVAGIFDHWLWSMFTGVIFWWLILLFGLAKVRAEKN